MKIHTRFCGILAAGCALGVALTPRAAAVTDEEFNTWKTMVQQLVEKVQKLEGVHDQDQKTHEQDQQQIQRLKEQLGETQKTATDAQQKAEAVAQAQTPKPMPGEGNATHNLTMVGDAQIGRATCREKEEAVAQAQTPKPMPGEGNATHNFTMVGDAEVQFGKTDGQHSGFVLADFAPIFLFRARDNVLFEAGFDIKLQNGSVPLATGMIGNSGASTTFDMSFAQLDYMFNNYVTFVAGDMLLPLGTYTERGAGWINKIPDDPLPRGVLPTSGIGAQLRGAIPLDQSGQHVTYAAYLANGPGSVNGAGTAIVRDPGGNPVLDAYGNTMPNLDLGSNVGFDSNGNSIGNLHGAPAGGGRIGWFYPWKPHYDLELGASGMVSQWDTAGSLLWSAAVADAALHISPYFKLKGEYIYSWQQTSDIGTIKPWGWWIQAGYKLSGLNLELPVINNLELVGRYDTVRDGYGTTTDRWTVGYVYYFSNTLLFQGDYEWLHSNSTTQPPNLFVFQVAYGF